MNVMLYILHKSHQTYGTIVNKKDVQSSFIVVNHNLNTIGNWSKHLIYLFNIYMLFFRRCKFILHVEILILTFPGNGENLLKPGFH